MATKDEKVERPDREWTLMFYFASDNPLAPGVVSQLKSLKQAGFHSEVNVIAQFDPQSEGTPTHIFDVNHVEKLFHPEQARIGYIGKNGADDPTVSNMIEDKLWRDERDRDGGLIRDRLGELISGKLKAALEKKLGKKPGKEYEGQITYAPPEPPADPEQGKAKTNGGASNGASRATKRPGGKKAEDGAAEVSGPQKSLREFLKFCREKYPARHYMLFILGHGVVVGNDVFLYDENADQQTLSLQGLAKELGDFRTAMKEQNEQAEFELVSFHSCSVSSLEVVYQLSGKANYMLASQGPAFVGSWPYRQILMRVFKNASKLPQRQGGERSDAERLAVKRTLLQIFQYCFHNSTDFLVAGYSFDLCLCSLTKAAEIKTPLADLSKALSDALGDWLLREFILLAHWRAQSYWQESYTDLHDFCLCLRRECEQFEDEFLQNLGKGDPRAATLKKLRAVVAACKEMDKSFKKEIAEKGDRVKRVDELIVAAKFAGPGHQYSHGLSVYFPWSEPLEDNPTWRQYQEYAFKDTGWLGFLTEYFKETRRKTRGDETKADADKVKQSLRQQETDEEKQKRRADELGEDLASLVYIGGGRLSGENALNSGSSGKVTPRDPMGDECGCASVKNYPRDTRSLGERSRAAQKHRAAKGRRNGDGEQSAPLLSECAVIHPKALE